VATGVYLLQLLTESVLTVGAEEVAGSNWRSHETFGEYRCRRMTGKRQGPFEIRLEGEAEQNLGRRHLFDKVPVSDPRAEH